MQSMADINKKCAIRMMQELEAGGFLNIKISRGAV